METVALEVANSVDKSDIQSQSTFEQLLALDGGAADTYYLDETVVSSIDNNQFLQLNDQIEQIVDTAVQEIIVPPGADVHPAVQFSMETINKALEMQAELLRISLMVETASATKQSAQTLFNMQQ